MKIPVIILGGFLGSGKTTLLLSLLKESKARGLTPGIVMNELGKKDVDGYILEEHAGANVEKLLDGCVCCSRKDELPRTLELLLARRPDVIYIELTGVADPEEIAKSLLVPALSGRLVLHYSITVLDAENALEYGSRFSADKQLVRTLRRQLSSADLIIVNKSDLVEPETLWRIEKMASRHNTDAEIVFTHYSKINLDPLLAGISPQEQRTPAAQRGSRELNGMALKRINSAAGGHGATAVQEPESAQQTSYSQVAAVTLTFPPGAADGIRQELLEGFFREWGDSLVRAKGHVRLAGRDGVQLVQYAGNRCNWEFSRYPGQPYVVFIGLNLDEKQLTDRWSALFYQP
ncbi:CobW family GTP-binding protein [Paenibacillus riograndensis]|uniref:CobW/P47K family protein n=1 Tax=Paenibacillus riograndensis SBR5 TaxID=1073571 RepID=A0A0E4HAC2_9BACL|nr:GTP-binding protein [Paenibacillus riograndensis]CQR54900.1 CobW/P47K family protein [Paenibacillus riograndensis SBR5]